MDLKGKGAAQTERAVTRLPNECGSLQANVSLGRLTEQIHHKAWLLRKNGGR